MADAPSASAYPDISVYDTFPKLLRYNAQNRADKPAMREKNLGIWQSFTWAEVKAEVDNMAAGLLALGLKRGDRIAIIGDNRPRLYWMIAVAQSVGAIPVPVYQDSVADEMKYPLEHAEARFALAEDQEQVDKLLYLKESLPTLEHIIFDEPRGVRDYSYDYLHDYEDIVAKGSDYQKANPGIIDAEVDKGTADDICIIPYTSGTTGNPKGVLLTFHNLLTAAYNGAKFEGLREDDQVLAYLPLAWIGDTAFSYAQAYICGFCVACPENSDTVLTDLRELGPTYFFAPPRIFENILTQVSIRIEDAGKLKRDMYHYFMKVARRVGIKILEGETVSGGDRFLYWLGNVMVYGPLKNVLGLSRVRIGYTAGEAIGPDIFDFYRSLGINLKQLYGSTETSVFVTIQPDGQIKPDTVGVPVDGVDIKIADSGELMIKGPGIFKEYFKNDEATVEAKDGEWFHTGDAGFLDEDGHLKIIDRAKDVGKLNDNSLFAPKYIENKLKFFPEIREAVAFGNRRDYCAAFINIDHEAVGNWAERRGIAYASYQELAALPQVYDMIQEQVAQVNQDLAGEERVAGSQIRRFLILHKMLDADDGELTRTSKVRRRFIADKYGVLIEGLYSDATQAAIETEITFEDGRKGTVKADLEIRNAETVAPTQKISQAAE